MDRVVIVVGMVVALVIITIFMSWQTYRISSRRAFADVPNRPLVLVVGAGLAGLTAAVSLATYATVVVAEQALHVGGNSARAKSGVARPTKDTPEKRRQMLDDLLRAARTRGADEKHRAERLVDEATAAHDWIREVLHVRLSEAHLTGGHTEPRTFATAETPVGATLIENALATAKEMGVTVCTDSRLEDVYLHPDGDGVVAVFANKRQQRCDAIVFATGGYAHPDSALLRSAAPHLAQLPTTNGSTSAVGSQVHQLLHRRLGAALRDLDRVQVHPTAFVDPEHPTNTTKELLAEAVRGMGALLVNENGQRFVDELKPRDEVVAAMRESGSKRFFVLLPRSARDSPLVKKYVERGLFVPFDKSPLVKSNNDISGYPLVAEVTPALHYSMGGLAVDIDGRVLRDDGTPIPRVYAAGEATGGLHGRNRLAGNSLLECVVYGRVVARSILKDSEGQEALGFDVSLCKTTRLTLAELIAKPSVKKRLVTDDELAGHDSVATGLWIALNDVVYDVAAYADRHPHGPQCIIDVGGTDASDAFAAHHPPGLADTYIADAVQSGTIQIVGMKRKDG